MRSLARGVAVVLAMLLASSALHAAAPNIQGCQIYPDDNLWNRDISADPIDPRSDEYVSDVLTGGNQFLHADFGTNPDYGIPFVVVSGTQPKIAINFDPNGYPDESDPGPYPIPLNAPIEGGSASSGDRHVIALDKDNAILYELYAATPQNNAWVCFSAAKFDLKSNTTRPDGFTSADAAGLPILPGLARFDEVANGQITHALRFTVHRTQHAYVAPATHFAGSTPSAPPMGARFRLKASFDISNYTGQSRVILEGLKKYGMMVADNGSDWFISGASDPRWDDNDLDQLKTVPGSAFEVVIAAGSNGSGGGGSPPEITNVDSDTDGVSDVNEIAAGTDPLDPNSFLKVPMTVTKFQGAANFKTTRDSCSITGIFPAIASGFNPFNAAVKVNVGGAVVPFTLDAKGRAKNESGKFQLKLKPVTLNKQTKQITFNGGDVPFKAMLKAANLSSNWSDEGISAGSDVKSATLQFVIDITFDGNVYTNNAKPLYTGKPGSSGKFKLPK